LRMLVADVPQHRRKQVDQGRWSSTEVNATGRTFLVLIHCRQRLFGLGNDPPSMHDQLAPRGRRESSLADALDEFQPTAVLEFTNLLADRRLRQVQALRRLGEAAEFNDFDQRAKLIEIQVPHNKASLYEPSEQSNCLICGVQGISRLRSR